MTGEAPTPDGDGLLWAAAIVLVVIVVFVALVLG